MPIEHLFIVINWGLGILFALLSVIACLSELGDKIRDYDETPEQAAVIKEHLISMFASSLVLLIFGLIGTIAIDLTLDILKGCLKIILSIIAGVRLVLAAIRIAGKAKKGHEPEPVLCLDDQIEEVEHQTEHMSAQS